VDNATLCEVNAFARNSDDDSGSCAPLGEFYRRSAPGMHIPVGSALEAASSGLEVGLDLVEAVHRQPELGGVLLDAVGVG
jgi:hypothetical protein